MSSAANRLVRIEAERYHKATGKAEREIRYYITSLKPDAVRLNQCIRQHWGIENKLHWVLDVDFGEDLDRKRAGHAAQNFSLLNRIALNLLKQEQSLKRGIKGKRLKAAWNHSYLLKLLGFDMRRPCFPSATVVPLYSALDTSSPNVGQKSIAIFC